MQGGQKFPHNGSMIICKSNSTIIFWKDIALNRPYSVMKQIVNFYYFSNPYIKSLQNSYWTLQFVAYRFLTVHNFEIFFSWILVQWCNDCFHNLPNKDIMIFFLLQKMNFDKLLNFLVIDNLRISYIGVLGSYNTPTHWGVGFFNNFEKFLDIACSPQFLMFCI